MFSKLFSFLITIERTVEHDVEAIISDFTDTIAKLEAAAVAKYDEAVKLQILSTNYEKAADEADAAAQKARAVAGKIKALVA
jgi:hypothetical protein